MNNGNESKFEKVERAIKIIKNKFSRRGPSKKIIEKTSNGKFFLLKTEKKRTTL